MSLKSLTTAQMVELSARWLSPEAERPVFEQYDELRGALALIEKVHDALSRTQQAVVASADEIQTLTMRMGELDAVHDRKARGIFNMLTALSELSDDPTESHAMITLRNALFPQGLTVTLLSYAEQADEIRDLRDSLTPEQHAQLAAIPMPHGTLDQSVEEWFTAGVELGALWAHREGHQQGGDQLSASDVLRARNQWLGAVRVILAALDMASVSDDARRRILGPLREARDATRGIGSATGSGER